MSTTPMQTCVWDAFGSYFCEKPGLVTSSAHPPFPAAAATLERFYAADGSSTSNVPIPSREGMIPPHPPHPPSK